jgi:hypothetical protein
MHVAEGTRLTLEEPQLGQATSPRRRCDANSRLEPNQPSKRCPPLHKRSKTIMFKF